MSIQEIEHKSYTFIEQNFNVTFADLPEDLFKIWHISIPIKKYLAGNYQDQYEFRIFRYALRKYETEKNISIPEAIFPSLFRIFQQMLSIPALRTPHFPREVAFQVFDFQLYMDLL